VLCKFILCFVKPLRVVDLCRDLSIYAEICKTIQGVDNYSELCKTIQTRKREMLNKFSTFLFLIAWAIASE